MPDKISALKEHASAHYQDGGHWLVETYETADWQSLLDDCDGNLGSAMRLSRALWEAFNEQQPNCAWGE